MRLLHALSGLADFFVLFVGGNAAFNYHKLCPQLAFDVFSIRAAEGLGLVESPLAAGRFFLEKVIHAGMTVYRLTVFGQADTLFSTTMGLYLRHNNKFLLFSD